MSVTTDKYNAVLESITSGGIATIPVIPDEGEQKDGEGTETEDNEEGLAESGTISTDKKGADLMTGLESTILVLQGILDGLKKIRHTTLSSKQNQLVYGMHNALYRRAGGPLTEMNKLWKQLKNSVKK